MTLAATPGLACSRGRSTLAGGLKDLAPRNVHVGVVADKWQLQDSLWQPFILQNFNLLTLGKLKWEFIRPSATTFDFSETDWMVAFCAATHLAMHGHNLCWNASNPTWLTSTITKANAETLLSSHIAKVVSRYAGQIGSWDVVNEPVATWRGRPDGLYPGPWLDTLGPRYLDVAFHATAEADPFALRVLNIAHVEQPGRGSEDARRLTLALVEALLKRGVPLQAVGLESHLAGNYSVATDPSRVSFLRELKQFGLQILLTELDVDDTKLPADNDLRDELVAACYGRYLEGICPEAEPTRVTFFCPSDRANWYDAAKTPAYQRIDGLPHRPGLLTSDLAPKPSYAAVARAFQAYAA